LGCLRFAKKLFRPRVFSATKRLGAGLLKEIRLNTIDRTIIGRRWKHEQSDLTPRAFNGDKKPLFSKTIP
jgi:hypothetical protein